VPQQHDASVAASSFDAGAPLEERIRALEQAIGEERAARQLLQEEVFVLTAELERFAPPDSALEAAATADAPGEQQSRRSGRRETSATGRIATLVAAGFQPGEAEWIVRRESELQMDALQARYDAEKNGESFDYFGSRSAAASQLRDELGDQSYERYLEANGRPTAISISTVMESSPAQQAGLRPGDQIVRYDGQRIFSMSDLSRQTMQGESGTSVAVDIVRDGIPMQVVLPRGPVGISAGRRFSR